MADGTVWFSLKRLIKDWLLCGLQLELS